MVVRNVNIIMRIELHTVAFVRDPELLCPEASNFSRRPWVWKSVQFRFCYILSIRSMLSLNSNGRCLQSLNILASIFALNLLFGVRITIVDSDFI